MNNNINYEQQISSIVSNTLDKEVEKLKIQIMKQMPQKMMMIKNEIFTDYCTIIKSVFKSIFDNEYGINYDEESMIESINFSYGMGLLPHFTIDESKFHFAPKYMRLAKSFNTNEESGYTPYRSMRRRSEEVDLTGKIKNFFSNDDGNSVDDEYGWVDGVDDVVSSFEQDNRTASDIEYDMENVSIQAYNLKKENNQSVFEAITPVSGTYQTAKVRAEQEFLRIYNAQIKARIFKKYGIKI